MFKPEGIPTEETLKTNPEMDKLVEELTAEGDPLTLALSSKEHGITGEDEAVAFLPSILKYYMDKFPDGKTKEQQIQRLKDNMDYLKEKISGTEAEDIWKNAFEKAEPHF